MQRLLRLQTLLLLAAIGLCPKVVAAQGQSAPAGNEIIIGGNPPPPPARGSCIEVEIGGDRAFNCLNQQLKREVDRVDPLPNVPPVSARSQDVRIGIVNVPAVAQQYGQNFGRSVVPFRPPPLIFAPIGAHH
jgi:hypothetical protein